MAERFVWTSANGTVIDLSDDNAGYIVTADGTAGLRAPTWKFTSQEYAGEDGEQVQAVKAATGAPTLGLHVVARNATDFRARVRGLIRAMSPRVNGEVMPGTLTVSNETGESRSLDCYVQDGLPGDETPGTTIQGRLWKVALKLYAPDPWWYGPTQTVQVGLGLAPNFFPFPPMNLAPSNVQGEFTVDLSATDNDAYPVWTITGPGGGPNGGLLLANNTTGLSLSMDYVLADKRSMTIDTRRGQQSVRLDDGTNLLPNVTPGTDPSLFPLVADVNDLSLQLAGATSDSSVVVSYAPRYAGI